MRDPGDPKIRRHQGHLKEVSSMINRYITELVDYGISKGLIDELDRVYTTNKLIEFFGLTNITSLLKSLKKEIFT